MKIAMMTRWNVPSGQSAHAEPVGRAWLEMGYDLKVLAPRGMELTLLYQGDEPYVRRCYMLDVWEARQLDDYFFDSRPFLEEDYEIFLVEDVEIMPMPELLEIFPHIKKKAKTILIVHEVGLPPDPNWYRFDWDAIVCFDERYKQFMAKAFPEEKIVIIPFPCHPPLYGDRMEARRLLKLPLEKKIVFSYGFGIANTHVDLFPVMDRLLKASPVLLLLITHHEIVQLVTKPEFLLLKNEVPATEKLYSYLHASDAYVYYVRQGERKTMGVGVSSSVAACLGAGQPILVPGWCNFFDLSGKEVIKYRDLHDLELKLRDVFEDTDEIRRSLAAAKEYVARNSAHEIAARFIDLFRELNECM